MTFKMTGDAMKISKTKGIAPRSPLLKQVYLFDSTMGVILSHLRANNSQEIDAIRDAAKLAATATFTHVRNRVKPVGKEAPIEVKIRHNDSVSWLRTRYAKTINKISKSNFGYDL